MFPNILWDLKKFETGTKRPTKKRKKVGVARLKPTRDDKSKGTRIGPSLFYTSELQTKYIKIISEFFHIIHLVYLNEVHN